MSNIYDVIVIGGGIIGFSCSYYLAKDKKRVLVIEKGEIGEGASGSCDDLIFLQSKRPGISLEMALESLEMYKGLSDELGMDLEFTQPGGMILIESQSYMETMESFVDKQRRYGFNVDIMGRKELKKRIPFIGDVIVGATFSPMDGQVNPLRVVFGYMARSQSLGVKVEKGTAVTGIRKSSRGHWMVTTSQGQCFESELVINACGAWASKISEMIGEKLPVTPKRGQLVLTEALPPVCDCNLLSAGYIVSKLNPKLFNGGGDCHYEKMGLGFSFSRTKEGKYLIGSTRENAGYEKGTTYEGLKAILAQANSFFPVLRNAHIIRHFSGLRPATAGGKPYVGQIPGKEGFFVAAGHEGDGIALAPITGKIISKMVSGKPCGFDMTELAPPTLASIRC